MLGLTSDEAAKRLTKFGPNNLSAGKKVPAIVAFLSRLANPLVLILLLAAGLSAFLGDAVSFVIILSIVTVSIVLDFVNTYKSQKAADALKARVRVETNVLRDGEWTALPLAQLVPGDWVKLAPGTMIPADGSVIESNDCYANESSLTGESFPQFKQVGAEVWMGASITSGGATMEVRQTGHNTKFSHVAAAVSTGRASTEFDREIRDFSLLIIKITAFLVIVIFAINAVFRHNVLEALLFSLALSVGLTPELLPLIITLNLTKGSLDMAKHGVIVKRLSAIQDFGSMDILCTDKTGTLTEDKIALVKYVDGFGAANEEVLLMAYITSIYTAGFETPLDRAVKAFRHLSTKGYAKIDEMPFDFERKRESVVVSQGGKRLLVCKGAPEELFKISAKYHDGRSFKGQVASRVEAEYQRLSADGFRVLAVATKHVAAQTDYTIADEHALEFQGFVAFLDPAKESVAATLKLMHEYGVEIKIITGDNALVSQKIAHDIDLPVKGIVSGADLDKLSDVKLAKLAEETTIFARAAPEQKMRIIKILQSNGHVVGYMGDGINDAPSLKAADIGISVNNAVDVAKDSADLILMHKSLHELIEGVIDGRKTFTNTMKYLMMDLSSNFGNMFSMAAASIVLPFLPMLATQILLNNLLYDGSQFAIPADNVDAEDVKQPHKMSIRNIRRFMWVFGPLSSIFDIATFATLILVFHLNESSFQAGWFLESMLTQIFVVYIIRTKKIPFVESRPAKVLVLSSLAVASIAFAVVLLPIASFFKFGPLPVSAIIAITLIVSSYLVVAQAVKQFFYRRAMLL